MGCETILALWFAGQFGCVGTRMTVSEKAKTAQQARLKARERRLAALDANRAARDDRIEAAAAAVFLGLDKRGAAQRAVLAVENGIGAALRSLLDEDITVEQAAELCEMPAADVRRFIRRRSATQASQGT